MGRPARVESGGGGPSAGGGTATAAAAAFPPSTRHPMDATSVNGFETGACLPSYPGAARPRRPGAVGAAATAVAALSALVLFLAIILVKETRGLGAAATKARG